MYANPNLIESSWKRKADLATLCYEFGISDGFLVFSQTWWTIMALYRARPKLEKRDAITAPATAKGHKTMASPAKGTQTVSRKGPSLPIKSSNSLFHPIINMYGLFHRATPVIRGTSMAMAMGMMNRLFGNLDNLWCHRKSSEIHEFYKLGVVENYKKDWIFIILGTWCRLVSRRREFLHWDRPWMRSKNGSKNL